MESSARPKRPQNTPSRGWGCKYSSRELPTSIVGLSLVFRSKSKSFEDKIKQNPLKHRFRGFFICCRSVSLRHCGAPTQHSPNLEVSLRISAVKIRDTYSEMRGHFDILGQKNQLLANFSTDSCLHFLKNSQMKSTFRILFFAKWEASDKAKMLPIYVRITINGTKARFSLNGGESSTLDTAN